MTLQGWSVGVSRWSVASLGGLLAAGAATYVWRAPGTLVPLVEAGLALAVGIGLLAGGVWLRRTDAAPRVGRLAVWSIVGIVVGAASLTWIAFVLSIDGELVGDPVVLALNGTAVFVAVFTLLGYFATRLQQRERRLVESRSRFRALTENSPFAVLTADETGTIQYANDAVEDLFGYEASELVGTSMDRLFRESPGDAEDSELEGTVPSGVHTFEWSRGTLTALTADGDAVPVRVSFGEYLEGSTHLFTGIVQDVSERRLAEDRLQVHSAKVTRLHGIANDIARADSEAGVYRRAVEGAVELFDCAGATLYVVENDRLHPEASAGAAPGVDAGQPSGTEVALEDTHDLGGIVRIEDLADTRSTTSNGSGATPETDEVVPAGLAPTHPDTEEPVTLRAAMSIPLDDVGVLQVVDHEPGAFTEGDEKVAELLATHVVTAHRRVVAERRIRRERDRLEEFASVLSHDIRNPLSVARGRLHLAQGADDPAEHLAEIDRAHERIDHLIEDVLSLAKQGNQVGETETVDLELAAREAWETVATDDATLRFDDLGEIEADRPRLLQLLENLYRNAIAHGGADVTVTVGSLDRGFYVEDTGPGVPQGDRESVFESGYSTDPEGTGFGLAIVAGIVESHGWSITLTDGTAGGARFEITGVDIRPG